MQDLSPSFIVKLGAIPQPILATIALMAEMHDHDGEHADPRVMDDYVDFENLNRASTRPVHRPSPGEK